MRERGRRASREQAVFLLYQHDLTGLPLEELEGNARRGGDPPLDDFGRSLVSGVLAERGSLDEAITGAAEGWTADRLAPLERNILRVAIHELRSRDDIPPAVSINEAVDLAKRYCQAEASGLVNGILGRIAADVAGPRS
ncbi:MAG: transcription antitermination protein NusB [Miltoncostaeaceae bacterium]|jgi:N utilization substance protein B|nr:transcription antitermination protein NusB [Miltoncostaeaceae bacterium]